MSFSHAYCYWFRCSIYLLVCICVHIAVRLCCVCVIHFSHTHTDVIVGLLVNNATDICVSVAFVLFFLCERNEVVSRNNTFFNIM